jgi:hypothetical protein
MGAEELLDQVKVKDLLHHLQVIGRGVNNLNLEGTVGLGANVGGVNIGNFGDLVGGKGLGGFEDLVGDGLGSGGTVAQVVLDTKIGIGSWKLALALETMHMLDTSWKEGRISRTTRVVTGSQQDTTSGLSHTDQVAGGRGAEDAILADQELLDTVGSADFGNLLDNLGVIVATITTNDKESSFSTLRDGEQDAGDESFGVVGLLEDLDPFTKTRSMMRMIS